MGMRMTSITFEQGANLIDLRGTDGACLMCIGGPNANESTRVHTYGRQL